MRSHLHAKAFLLAIAVTVTGAFHSGDAAPNREKDKDYLDRSGRWADYHPNRGIEWTRKKIVFELRAKPWDWMLPWLASEFELEFVAQVPPPQGLFTFINPTINGKPREY